MCYNFHHPYFYTTDAHRTILYTRPYIYISPYMHHHPHNRPIPTFRYTYIPTTNGGGGATYVIAYCIIYLCWCHISCFPCWYMHIVLPFITLHISWHRCTHIHRHIPTPYIDTPYVCVSISVIQIDIPQWNSHICIYIYSYSVVSKNDPIAFCMLWGRKIFFLEWKMKTY